MNFFFISLFFLLSLISFAHSENWGIVSVPVIDLRASSGSVATSYDYDPLQETQLLYGEVVKIVAESGNWLFVSAMEQQEFSHKNRWEGYPGWVRKDAILPAKKIFPANFVVQKKFAFLCSSPTSEKNCTPVPMGTQLRGAEKVKGKMQKILQVNGKPAWVDKEAIRALRIPLSQELARKKIIESASQLLGDPYFWGGRSAHLPELKEQVTAVDCSGLVNLAYRVAGIEVPRDSLEQYMRAKKIKASQMKIGDLIFSAPKDKPEKISHVAIFVDTTTLIEAPQTGMTVRKISFQEKFGMPFEEMEDGKIAGDRVVYFCTYFNQK